MVDKTLEAFGLTREEMEQANQQAADQMLPVPYDIPGEVGPVKEDRFGDTAARAAKDSWEEAKARFQSRGTEEGVAGAIPDADSSVLNTFAAGLGYAADMGLSGLAASDAAWRYSVGLASELIPGMDNNQEQRFTRDVSSIPEAFAGNVTGVVGGIDRLPDLRKATAGSRAPNSRPSAVIRRDDQFRGEGNMPLSYTPGRTPADFVGQFAIRTTKQDQIDDIIESGLIRQKVDGYGLKKKSTLYFGLQDTPETKAGIMPGQLTTSQPYALVAKADEAAKYDKKGGIPLDALQHIWTMRDGQMVDILSEVLQANRNFKPTNPKSFNKGGMVDKTPEAFGLTYEDMEKRNRDAADQMLPLPYDIEPRVNVLKLPRAEFLSYLDEVVQGDTPRRDFLIREYNKANSLTGGLSTEPEEGRRSVAGSGGFLSKPEGESGLGALSGLRLEPAVGAAGVAQGLEQAITATGRSAQGLMPSEDVTLEALGVAGMATAGGIASRGPSALDFDPNQVNIFGGMGARDPGYDRSGGRLPESVGADGQYRFEINDSPMVVLGSNIKAYSVPNSNSLTKLPEDTSKLKDVMVHDEFFKQYPELGDIPVVFNNLLEYGHHGSLTTFDFKDGTQKSYLQLNPQMLLGEPELLKRVLIHEVQHAVQDREGFAGGTSPKNKDVREQVAFEIESPENVEIWNQYTKDLEAFRKPENLVAPLEAAKDFILAYSDKNEIRLRDPNFLDRIKDRFTGREQSIVEGNLKVMLNSIDLSLENIKSGYKVNFDHYRGGLDSLYRKLGSIVGKEDKDLFEGIVGFSPDVINPKGYGLGFDTMEWFSDIYPMLPDLPAPGTAKFSGISDSLLYSTYRRKRGEVESENSAIRAEMSLQERFDTSPEDTELTGQGIPRSRQWGDPYNSGGSSSSSLSASEPATVISARNANLENWSENAYFKDAEGLPQQLYHGMSGNLRGQPVEFSGENLEPSYMGTLGPGTYLTRDPSVASDFATGKRAGYTDEKFGGQVVPVYTNVTKVVDDNVINSNKELRTEIADLIEENTDDNYLFNLADKLRSEDDINLSSLFTKTEDGKVRSTGVGSLVSSLLESKGYEGISVVTDKGFHEAVIFPGHGGVEFPRQNIKSSLQGPEGQYSRETNDMRFNEGGLAMERQMNTMMAEGGIKDSGMNRDPISGNEIPAGSLAKEVRDDVDAKLSEGEYVVPADVVRFFGVNYFEKLRQKAKAGLEEMDKDGRIGGDPVSMDDDFPFSDEELMSVEDEPIAMNEGGAVSAFNPAAFQPGGFGASGGSGQSLPTETKTYINANGEIRSVLFINGQPIQQIPSGFLEDTPENRAKLAEGTVTPDSSVESTSSKDRDRSVQTAQSTGEKKSGYSLDEDQLKSLDEDPAAFGQAALKGDIFTGKNLGTLGMAINPALGLLGVAAGTYNEMRNIAGARSALEVMESRELTDTPEYRKLASDLKAKEDNLGLAAKGLDSIMDFSGKTGAASLIKSDPAPMTPQAIPTVVNRPDRDDSTGMTYAPAVNPLVGKSGSEMLPSSSKSSTKTTTTKKSTPSGATPAAKAKIDAGSTGYSSPPKKETTEQKLKRGGGFASGGLVQRPKKKPVAKK